MTTGFSAAIKQLSESDELLRRLFTTLPNFQPEPSDINFENTARIIIGQQLSIKAADTIYKRVCELAKSFTPAVLASLPTGQLRKCGLSGAKARYVQQLANKCIERPNYLSRISYLDDLEAAAEIQSNPGFGPWSAQIFLLFHLRRPDIFPYGDATLNRAIKLIYQIDPKEKSELEKVVSSWAPHRSVVCLALWKWIDEGMPELQV